MASKVPAILSIPRFTTLFVSLLVTLSSGTNYVYSAGNIGVYSSGPLWGRIVDLRGPRILMTAAFLLLLAGYSGIRHIYDSGLPETATTISTLTSVMLVICGFMTGSGGNAGLTGAVNSTAKTFPDKARATATGLVISGFGLSAFLFSTISRIEFAGNTSSFLRLLAFGTAIPMIAGFFFVRPIPLPPLDSEEEARQSTRNGALRMEDQDRDQGQDIEAEESRALLAAPEVVPDAPVQLSRRAALNQGFPPNVYGRKLWTSSDFWLLFSILSMLAGTGLMFINNVGLMSQALYIKSVDVYNPVDAAQWQANQVAAISLLNFSGRIFIGDGGARGGGHQAPVDGERDARPRARERVLAVPERVFGVVWDA
ncbi:hypothetical protein H0H92_009371 [Tricholoma furcatifolium]|nr:hypothetical protein H0H92_009371 [Tricholoma furcatifolium]